MIDETTLREAYATLLRERAAAPRDECPAPETLLALAERRGAESERLASASHAMACPSCRRELDLLRAVAATAQPTAVPVRRRAYLALAAAAGIVLAAVATLRTRAALHEPVVRGAGEESSILVAPAAGASTGAAPTLVWHRVPDASSYVVEVLDSLGERSFGATVRDTTVIVAPPVAAGRYRWTVTARTPGADLASAPRTLVVAPR